MPNSLPSIDDVIAGKIKFFSLDTSVIQGAGYKFFDDKLLDLYLQLPYQIKLILPEIVYREILSHKNDEVVSDINQLKSSLDTLIRKEVLSNQEFSLDLNMLKDRFIEAKTSEIDQYIKQFDGEVIPIANSDISRVFNWYFSCKAPFENNKAKKNEFPDAVCLDLIEEYAIGNNQIGIIVSGDKGWGDFAEGSKNLYYASSIDEFTKLFTARHDEISESIRTKIITALEDEQSNLYSEIVNYLDDVYWDTSGIYSENLYSCDADVVSYDFNHFSVVDLNIWKSERESATWILKADLSFILKLGVEVESYIKDSIDKEFISMGVSKLNIDVNPEFQFHIICSNINVDANYSEWDMDIKLINNQYILDDIGIYHSFE